MYTCVNYNYLIVRKINFNFLINLFAIIAIEFRNITESLVEALYFVFIFF